MTCPPFDTLSAYADAQASAEEAAALDAHLPACAACAASLAALGSARRALAAYPVPPAPADLAARILSAAESAAGRRPWWRAFFDELAAGLAQPAGAVAAAALALAVFFAWRSPGAAPELAEAPLEVPVEVLTAAHRRYALSMPLAPVESAEPALLQLAGGPEARDVY